MIFKYDLIHKSTMPERFKTALLEDLSFIEKRHLVGLLQILLFGSLSRSDVTRGSDVDLCLVFVDGTDMTSREMRTFRGELRAQSSTVETDVVTCTKSQLKSNSCLLYQEINRDKIILAE